MAAPHDWASVINDADDATARLILQYQLDDIKALEDAAADSGDADQQTALRLFKAALQHHHALRHSSPPHSPATTRHREASPQPVAAPQSPPTPPAPPVTVVTFACEACGDKYDADHCYQAPCQHWYCDEDLAQLFRASMTDQALYPPRCCRQQMPFEDVQLFLDPKLRQEFGARKEELDEKQPTYCHVPACSTYLGQATKDGSEATCPACGTKTCVLCKQAGHAGDCPTDEAAKQTEDLAKAQGWQRCIDCRRLVELNLGCNHMTCVPPLS